jgi:hypothetical protein
MDIIIPPTIDTREVNGDMWENNTLDTVDKSRDWFLVFEKHN